MAPMKNISSAMAGLSVSADPNEYPVRPGYGTQGNPVVLWANYFQVTVPKNLDLHRYHVDVSPTAAGKKLKRVFALLLEDPAFSNTVTDFKAFVVSRGLIDGISQDGTAIIVNVPYRFDDEDVVRDGAVIYKVRVSYTGALSVDDIHTRLDAAIGGNRGNVIQALNALLNHYPNTRGGVTTLAGNKHFAHPGTPTGEKFSLAGGLEALRGYYKSVRPATLRTLVNLNISHGVFYRSGPLGLLYRELGPNKYAIEKSLKKIRISTSHLPAKKNKAGKVVLRIKTIFGFASRNDGHALEHPPQVSDHGAGAKDVKFWLDESPAGPAAKGKATSGKSKKGGPGGGRYVTVFDFFKQRENIMIPLHHSKPLLTHDRVQYHYHRANAAGDELRKPVRDSF